MASNVTRRSSDSTIVEHDVVRLSRSIATDAGAIAAGATGTVVHIHRGGTAFEVEFEGPFHIVTVTAGDVERIAA